MLTKSVWRRVWVVLALCGKDCARPLHEMLREAKDAKRDLDALKKRHKATMEDLTMDVDVGIDDLKNESARATTLVAEQVAEYSELVVFMRRCDEGACLKAEKDLDQTLALMTSTRTPAAVASEKKLQELFARNFELESALKEAAFEAAAERERLDDEISRLWSENQNHEKEATRLREADKKRTAERTRLDAEIAALEKEVDELKRQRAWECDTVTDHTKLRVAPDHLVIVRLYGQNDGKDLWWALAEVVALKEGDGLKSDSLIEVRFFNDVIKSPTSGLDGTFHRDFANVDLVRRDAIAYVDVQLLGGLDPFQTSAQYNVLDDHSFVRSSSSKGHPKDKPPEESRHPKKTTRKDGKDKKKSKFGVKIAEGEKRGIAARLDRDKVEWEHRDRSVTHDGKRVEAGTYVVYKFLRDDEVWFALASVVEGQDEKDVSNPDANVTVLPLEPPLRYPLNETALGDRFNRTKTSVVLRRRDVAYVDLAIEVGRGTLKSKEKSAVAKVLEQVTGRWWMTLADDWKRRRCPSSSEEEQKCPPPVGEEKKPPLAKQRRGERSPSKPTADVAEQPTTASPIPTNLSLATPEQVAAAEASEREEEDDSHLADLKRKLRWLVDVEAQGLVSAEEASTQRAKILGKLLD